MEKFGLQGFADGSHLVEDLVGLANRLQLMSVGEISVASDGEPDVGGILLR